MTYEDTPMYADSEVGRCSDVGNALRLAFRFEHDLRYVPTHGWYRYEGHRMVQLAGMPIDEGTALPDLIRQEALEERDADRRNALLAWAEKSAAGARIREALAIASDLPIIRTTHDQLDSDPVDFNTPVGMFNLRDGTVRPTVASDLLTKSASTFPKDEAPVFHRFLEEMVPSVDVRNFLQRAVGYSITGLTREEVFFILYGSGQNGKSKLLGGIAHALGTYAHTFDPKLVVQQKYEGHPTNIASLHGVRFAYSNEIDQGAQLDEGKVKALTGGDRITARFMRKDEFTFNPTHKLWLATNYLPVIKGTDKGMWRRIIVIPFDVTVPDEKRDVLLEEKLKAEAAGILSWAIDGARLYLSEGRLRPPVEVQMASAHYQQEQDAVSQFLTENTVPEAGSVAPASDLYLAYKRWAEDNGQPVLSSTAFGRELGRKGYDSAFTGPSGNRKGRKGLRLLERSWI